MAFPNLFKSLLLLIFSLSISFSNIVAQNFPSIKIDGNEILITDNSKFPYWLRAGQSIDLGSNVKLISILEYTVVAIVSGGNDLVFEDAITLTTSQIVPNGKIWKVESVGLDMSAAVVGPSGPTGATGADGKDGVDGVQGPTGPIGNAIIITSQPDTISVNLYEGLLVFNTTTKCFEYYAHNIWQTANCATCPPPDAASTIVGTFGVCAGNSGLPYSIPPITSSTSYTTDYIWNYTGTNAIINGTSNNITIDFLPSATSGDLTVKGSNICGEGLSSHVFSIVVSNIPPAPIALQPSLISETEITWNWSAVPGATSYLYNTINDHYSAIPVSDTFLVQNNLNCGTLHTLYVWALNNCGVSNTLEMSANTSNCIPNCGIITDDRDGNTYLTISIGNQCWMRENLKYLPEIHSNAEFNTKGSNSQPGYGVYDCNLSNVNDAKLDSNYIIYGVLYNWYAVMQGAASTNNVPSSVKGICPLGWHLPSDAEWIELEVFLGMDINEASATDGRGTDQGDQLKEAGDLHWDSGNNGNNSSGFTAFSSGRRETDGTYTRIGNIGYWWASTEDGTNAWRRFLYANEKKVYRNTYNKTYGFAVRCVKD